MASEEALGCGEPACVVHRELELRDAGHATVALAIGKENNVGDAPREIDRCGTTQLVTFHGMTAHPDERNCECHWGSSNELSLLKTPNVELEPDLLRRTWQAVDWLDHAAVLRRILPQFAAALVAGPSTSSQAAAPAGRTASDRRAAPSNPSTAAN